MEFYCIRILHFLPAPKYIPLCLRDFFNMKGNVMQKTETNNITERKKEINEKHIKFYDKTLSVLEFILDEYSRELVRTDMEFTDMPKNAVATLDFLISAIGKIQKGQRLALGLDEESADFSEPVINIVEGVQRRDTDLRLANFRHTLKIHRIFIEDEIYFTRRIAIELVAE